MRCARRTASRVTPEFQVAGTGLSDVLNRLFIVIGVIAILVIVAAFVAPAFIDWSSYRGRLEALASETLGTEVTVAGDVDVTLLPEPQLSFANVVIGPENDPFAEIDGVGATFSLTDFLRDRYSVTRLTLSNPHLNLTIDENGRFAIPVDLPETISASNVSVADAEIESGTVSLTDRRSGETWQAEEFAGTLQARGLRGPFSLTGAGRYDGRAYSVRVNASQMNAEGAMQVAGHLRPEDGRFSLSVEGMLQTREQLRFAGSGTYRRAAAGGAGDADSVRGDLVLTSQIEAATDQILLSDYTLEPDENRPATRLTGAAVIELGAERQFDAVVSGGVVPLVADDGASGEQETGGAYDVIELISNLPAPPVPPIDGQIGIDVTELDVGPFALRELRVDASTDGAGWSVGTFSAELPGSTELSLVGELDAAENGPTFEGAMTLDSARLDSLAQRWRGTSDGQNPLFNMPGSLSGRVQLSDGALSLADGRFVLDGVQNAVSVEMTVDETRRLSLIAQLGELDAVQSAALRALMPEVSRDGALLTTFPSGEFEVSAQAAQVYDLPATDLEVAGSWAPDKVTFDRLGASSIGGARLSLSGALSGSLSDPVISGGGQVSFMNGAASAALPRLLDMLDAPDEVRRRAGMLVPAELSVDLAEPNEAGGQELTVRGRAGVADIETSIAMSEGVERAMRAPVVASLTLNSGQPVAFAEQLGLGPVALVPEDGPIELTVSAEGAPANSLEMDVAVSGSGDSARFHGNVIVSDLADLRGRGSLEFDVSDVTPLAEMLGAGGVGYSGASGSADINFTRGDILSLSNIDAEAGDAFISGSLNRSIEGETPLFSGDLRVSAVEVRSLAALLGGPSTLVTQGAIWPDGPFSLTGQDRNSRGRIEVTAPFIRHEGRDVATDARFDLSWDETKLRIRGLKAALGGGTISLNAELCCTSGLPERQLSGRMTLDGVALDSVLPEAPAAALGGTVSGGATVNGTGDSYAAALGALAGEGSFSLSGFSAAGFDPDAFARVAGIENVVEVEPAELTDMVSAALRDGAFTAPQVTGVLSVANGSVRVSNIAAEGSDARLFGGGSLALSDLALDGNWTLSPTDIADGNELLSTNTAQITALLSGTLFAPERELDLAPMVDAIRVRALELEVDRLEELRAEQERRAREAAERRSRIMEQQARERAREEAERARAEAEARRQTERQQELDALLEQLEESRAPQENETPTAPSPEERSAPPLVGPQQEEAPANSGDPIDLFTDPFASPEPEYPSEQEIF